MAKVINLTGKLLGVIADQDDELDRLKNPDPISVNLPKIGFGTDEGGLASMDVEAFLNMRNWLQEALEAKGAKIWGAGIGCGQADVSIDLDGFSYNVSIRPTPRS